MGVEFESYPDLQFRFIAVDGQDYPVRVTFRKKLPATFVNGPGYPFRRDFTQRVSESVLGHRLPRCRITVDVDDTAVYRDPGTYTALERERRSGLSASGSALADQFVIAVHLHVQHSIALSLLGPRKKATLAAIRNAQRGQHEHRN